MHNWVRASPSDFGGTLPRPRSGHTAVNIGKTKIVVFGGLVAKNFIADITVYDIENRLWYRPECTGSGSDGKVGPSARAFHIAIAIDCHMFIFGGRSTGKRLGDFWVLDTDIWQWSELTSFGDLPSPRDFAAASAIGNRKIVMYGGWDGKKWLSDVFVMDTISLEWTELTVSGAPPPPRCGHTATMVEKRLLVYGGRGGGGPIMGDLWALKGLIEEENETPGWTQLKLPGQAPSPRCGHTVTSGGHYLLLFGGHGTGGWLSRYDIYHNDCVVLDRVSVQWKRLPTCNEPPAARAYHSMTCIGSRYLLFGGFDGKETYGDLWWLVPEDDPIAKRLSASPPKLNENDVFKANDQSSIEGNQMEASAMSELLERLQIDILISNPGIKLEEETDDTEFFEVALMVVGENASSHEQAAHAVREHWRKSTTRSILLKELSPLLHDYQRLITRNLPRNQMEASAMSELLERLQIDILISNPGIKLEEETDDTEFFEVALMVVGENASSHEQAAHAVREHWRKSTTRSILLKELSPLLHDYQRLITRHLKSVVSSGLHSAESEFPWREAYRFYHVTDVTQLRMDDIADLLAEYRRIPSI